MYICRLESSLTVTMACDRPSTPEAKDFLPTNLPASIRNGSPGASVFQTPKIPPLSVASVKYLDCTAEPYLRIKYTALICPSKILPTLRSPRPTAASSISRDRIREGSTGGAVITPRRPSSAKASSGNPPSRSREAPCCAIAVDSDWRPMLGLSSSCISHAPQSADSVRERGDCEVRGNGRRGIEII